MIKVVHLLVCDNKCMCNAFITRYSLTTYFESSRCHLQGNLHDYKESKQTVKIHK
jgi:hypothetical protein